MTRWRGQPPQNCVCPILGLVNPNARLTPRPPLSGGSVSAAPTGSRPKPVAGYPHMFKAEQNAPHPRPCPPVLVLEHNSPAHPRPPRDNPGALPLPPRPQQFARLEAKAKPASRISSHSSPATYPAAYRQRSHRAVSVAPSRLPLPTRHRASAMQPAGFPRRVGRSLKFKLNAPQQRKTALT